jgi:hypothetical protein
VGWLGYEYAGSKRFDVTHIEEERVAALSASFRS